LPSEFEIGAGVRVRGVGVYVAERDEKRNVVTGVRDIQVRVEDIGGVSLLTPKPFWTVGKVSVVFGFLVAILFVAVGLVHRARSRNSASGRLSTAQSLLSCHKHDFG